MRVRSRTKDNERGAALVEAAITAPLLFALIFGILEYAFIFRTYLTVGAMTNDGARAATAFGRDPLSDRDAIDLIRQAGSVVNEERIDYIVIYRAATPNAVPTGACQAGTPVTGECNVYRPSDWADEGAWTAKFGCDPTDLDRYYCPSSRLTTVDNLGFVGVYVQVEHEMVSGMFGETVGIEDAVVGRFEPDPPS